MHLILDAHPGIKNPGEIDCLFDSAGLVGPEPELGVAISFLERSRMFGCTGLTINRDCSSFRELLDDMIGQMDDGSVLCMNVHRNFDVVRRYFPGAKFVHLLRDPRDVARSSVLMGWSGVAYYGVDHWIHAENSWIRMVESARPSSCFELKYEDLIADLGGHLDSLCQFIGVEFDSAMTDYHKNSTYQPPDISLAYQWRRVQSLREVGLIEFKARDLIVRSGYDLLSDGSRGPGIIESARLWVANRAYRYLFFIKRYGILALLFRKPVELFPWLPGASLYRRRMNRILEEYVK
jgi:hypothetical protein